MKILVIVQSKHIGNTMMIAEAMSEVAPVTLCSLENAANYKLSDYDIVGFGGGIYGGKHDKSLISFAKECAGLKKYTFVFSTSGSGKTDKYNATLIKTLKDRDLEVLGSFGCKGLDKFFIFKLFGGINKGRPNVDDFDKAQDFILDIMNKYENAVKTNAV